MAELIREIEAADIPKLRDLMKLVFGDSEWEDIRRLVAAHRGGAVPLGGGVSARVRRGEIRIERPSSE